MNSQKQNHSVYGPFPCTLNISVDSESVNAKSKDQEFTALHLAVRGDMDNDKLVSALLRHPKIERDVRDSDDWTPLHHACHRGLINSVLALQNANFCCVNYEGDSPLHLAAANQHAAIFSALSKCESFRKKYVGNPELLEAKVSKIKYWQHSCLDNSLLGGIYNI